MKATLDDRLKSVTTVTGRFTSVAFDPSNIREGSAQPPPDTPLGLLQNNTEIHRLKVLKKWQVMKKAHCGNSTRMKKIEKQTAVIIIIIIILVVFIIHDRSISGRTNNIR